MALIFFLSSRADPQVPEFLLPVPDKAMHALLYAGLGTLVARALAGGWFRPVTLKTAAVAVAVASIYGISDELHQYFVPSRQMDAADLVADAAGASFASIALYLASRSRAFRQKGSGHDL
jgi:VanZ family protein